MDVWRLTMAALRRWYVLVPALGLAAALVIASGRGVAPEYETTGAALLVPPAVQSTSTNVYAQSSGPQALQIIVSGSATRAKLAAQGFDASYDVRVASRSSIFELDVRGADATTTIATGSAVLDELAAQLQEQQAALGIQSQAMAQLQILDAPDAVSASNSSATRVMAVVALLGVIGSVALAVCFDDLVLLLRRRRAYQRTLTPEGGSGDAPPADDPGDAPRAGDPETRSPDVSAQDDVAAEQDSGPRATTSARRPFSRT